MQCELGVKREEGGELQNIQIQVLVILSCQIEEAVMFVNFFPFYF